MGTIEKLIIENDGRSVEIQLSRLFTLTELGQIFEALGNYSVILTLPHGGNTARATF